MVKTRRILCCVTINKLTCLRLNLFEKIVVAFLWHWHLEISIREVDGHGFESMRLILSFLIHAHRKKDNFFYAFTEPIALFVKVK